MEKGRLRFDDPKAALAQRADIDEDERSAIDEEIRKTDSDTLDSRVRRLLRRIYGNSREGPKWFNDQQLRKVARELAMSQAAGMLPRRMAIVNEWRMCQTEVCLRLAHYLLVHDMVTSNVSVALSGREVTRQERPMFDIRRFMADRGAPTTAVLADGYGLYQSRYRFGIQVVKDMGAGDVVAELAPGSKLIVQASPGPVRNTRGSIEHAVLRSVIGTALTRADVGEDDVLAVAVPRSPRMRQVVKAIRNAPRLIPTRLSIVLVASSGEIDGLSLLRSYEAPELE
jgi:hypothetical protein